MDPEEDTQTPTIDDLEPKYVNELQEDTIMDKKVRTSSHADVEYIRVGLKGMNLSKARWMEIGRVRELYPHLIST